MAMLNNQMVDHSKNSKQNFNKALEARTPLATNAQLLKLFDLIPLFRQSGLRADPLVHFT